MSEREREGNADLRVSLVATNAPLTLDSFFSFNEPVWLGKVGCDRQTRSFSSVIFYRFLSIFF